MFCHIALTSLRFYMSDLIHISLWHLSCLDSSPIQSQQCNLDHPDAHLYMASFFPLPSSSSIFLSLFLSVFTFIHYSLFKDFFIFKLFTYFIYNCLYSFFQHLSILLKILFLFRTFFFLVWTQLFACLQHSCSILWLWETNFKWPDHLLHVSF